jgi:hypothetical protein
LKLLTELVACGIKDVTVALRCKSKGSFLVRSGQRPKGFHDNWNTCERETQAKEIALVMGERGWISIPSSDASIDKYNQ